MFINNRLASLIYKLSLLVVCLLGLLMNVGIFMGTYRPFVFLYYSVLSNLACFVFYAVAAGITFRNINKTGQFGTVKFAPHFKGGIVMMMLLNIIIFIFVLAGNSGTSAVGTLSNVIVHIIVPLMVLVDWSLFDKKGSFTGTDPLIWLAIPFAYYALVLFFGEPHLVYVEYFGGVHYPYRFIDPERILWAPVLFNLFILILIYVALSYALFGVDRVLGNRARQNELANAAQLAEDTAALAAGGNAAYQEYPATGDGVQTLEEVLAAPATAQPAERAPYHAGDSIQPGSPSPEAPVAAPTPVEAAATAPTAASVAPEAPAASPAAPPKPDYKNPEAVLNDSGK